MPIWIKLKVFAPFDNISNPGTKFQTIDGKKTIVNPEGSGPFQIKKGQFVPIPFEWKNMDEAKKKFDAEVFEFFKTKNEALKKCKKEDKLLKLLPTKKMEERRKRIQKKVDDSRFGQNRPTMDDVIKEAKNIGVDLPLNFKL